MWLTLSMAAPLSLLTFKQQENLVNPCSVSSAHLSVLTEAFLLGQPFPHHIKAGADLAVYSPNCVIEFRQRLLIPLPIKEINLKETKKRNTTPAVLEFLHPDQLNWLTSSQSLHSPDNVLVDRLLSNIEFLSPG